MPSLPSRRKVDRALAEASRAARSLVKEANRAAARFVAKGDYAGSQKLIEMAKTAGALQGEIVQLRRRCREALFGQSGGKMSKGEKTPLWQYYRHILAALAALGGSATRDQIEAHLDKSVATTLKPGDLEPNARGIPLWRVMVKRSQKHMLREKFIEQGPGKTWVMTAAGKKSLETQAAART